MVDGRILWEEPSRPRVTSSVEELLAAAEGSRYLHFQLACVSKRKMDFGKHFPAAPSSHPRKTFPIGPFVMRPFFEHKLSGEILAKTATLRPLRPHSGP